MDMPINKENIIYEDGEIVLESGNDVENYVVPEGVTVIFGEAFLNFENTKRIFVPKSVIKIESGAFAEIPLLEIVVDNDNTHYKSIDGVLYDYAVTKLIQCPSDKDSVTIPETVTKIGNSAFDCCTKLSNIFIPNSVTKIGNSAFATCLGLTEMVVPDSVTEIGDMAFWGCINLKSCILPKSVEIGYDAFYDCPLNV